GGGVHGVGQLAAQPAVPVDGVGVLAGIGDHLGGDLAAVELVAVGIRHRLGLAGGDHAGAFQLLGVELAGRLAGADVLVHQRLGRRRLVGLVVAVLAVADQVDDDVA